jgi:hypothetical protein
MSNNPLVSAPDPRVLSEIRALRLACWEAAEKDPQRINKVRQHLLKADKGTAAPDTVYYWQRVLIHLQQPKRPSRKAKYSIPEPLRQRYITAYREWQRKFPHWVADGHTLDPLFPDTSTANGLTTFCLKYLTWMEHRATRITTEGRSIVKNGESIRIPTQTRKGTADISATINGKAVMLEIKTGRDKPSEAQLKEQERERRAGGIYEFVHNVGEFFEVYDRIVLS